MMSSEAYLTSIIKKYAAIDDALLVFFSLYDKLKEDIKEWAGEHHIETIVSGSRAKKTAISLSSDIDLFVSLRGNKNIYLRDIYDSLHEYLNLSYVNLRKQNVSIRVTLLSDPLINRKIDVDITPGVRQPGSSSDHSLYVYKESTWKKTNILKHIFDISFCKRNNEIKLLKIWRERNGLAIPSIYLEYLVIDILRHKSTHESMIGYNFYYILSELAKENQNPLFKKIIDPANSNNILSNLLTENEKKRVITSARESQKKQDLAEIIW